MHKLIPIGIINNGLPKIKSRRTVKSLKDLYGLLSVTKAFKRYGACWNYFPAAFTIADLDNVAAEIRIHIKDGFAEDLVIAKEPYCRFVYGNLSKRKLLQMLKCIYSLRVDMLQCSNNGLGKICR